MWLEEFCKLFPEATERYAGGRQDLEKIEQKLVQTRTEMRVGSGELRIIEESTEQWSYAQWWPRLSSMLGEGERIELPRDLEHVQARQRAVLLLYDRLKHVEVVSVILRFLWPEHFAIISPPVVSILNLIPTGRENHPSHYRRYLQNLEDLRKYGGLENVADVDMALWSAAHFSREDDHPYESLVKQMYRDGYFQELRMRNLLIGIRKHWRQTDGQRALFARVFVDQDHLIAAKVYERNIFDIAARLNVKAGPLERGQTRAGNLVKKLDRRVELRKIGIKPGELSEMWGRRHQAVHDEPEIDRSVAKDFVERVARLSNSLREWRPPSPGAATATD